MLKSPAYISTLSHKERERERKHIRVICKVTVSLGLLSPPIHSFSDIHKVKVLCNVKGERNESKQKCFGM